MDKCFICHNMRIFGEGKDFLWITEPNIVLREEIIKWKSDGKIISRKVMKCDRCIKELKDIEAYKKPTSPGKDI